MSSRSPRFVPFPSPLPSRVLLACAGLVVTGGLLLVGHEPDDAGLAPADVVVPSLAEALASGASSTGALLVDMVEPADGEGGSEEAIAAAIARVGGAPAGFYSEGEHLYRVRGSAEELAAIARELADHPLVEGVEPEVEVALTPPGPAAAPSSSTAAIAPQKRRRFQPNDEYFARQWHMEMVHAPEAWAAGGRGQGTVVAVVDTGVAYKDAPGFRRVPDLAGTSFVPGQTFIDGAADGLDDHLHGTHVAGTIAQTTHNEIGVTGVAFEATIMSLKVLSREGRGSVAGIANAIRYAADHGAHVINMSLGGPLPSRVFAKAIEYAHERGVTVVCAAGNSGKSRVEYPAAYKGSVAVAAVDGVGERSWYSNYGKNLDMAAPGGDTRVDRNGDGFPDGVLQNTILLQDPLSDDYLWFQGTSMASPHAAGVAALVHAAGVTNPDEIERLMKRTAKNPGDAEWTDDFGAGVVDAAAAVEAAQGEQAPERAALGGFLALGALAGLGGLWARRRRIAALVTAGAGFGVGAGVGTGAPLAIGLATLAGGGAALGSPLLLSAAVPLALVLLLLGLRPLRAGLAGLSLGYAAFLLHGAVVLPTLVTGLPGGPTIDRLWLGANAVLALWLARRTFAAFGRGAGRPVTPA